MAQPIVDGHYIISHAGVPNSHLWVQNPNAMNGIVTSNNHATIWFVNFDAGGGSYRLYQHPIPEVVLDAPPIGNQVLTWGNNNQNNQRWAIEAIEGPAYVIRSIAFEARVLTSGMNHVPTAVGLAPVPGGMVNDNQKWMFVATTAV